MNSSNAETSDRSAATPSGRDGRPVTASMDLTQAHVPAGSAGDAQQVDRQAGRLVAVLDEYFARLKSGTAPDRDALLAAHPDLAEELAECLAGLDFIHAASEPRGIQPPLAVGDFRIIREVGQGGMGAVYEAEQISLRRRVALKILRFSGVSDPDAIKRFQREAETVARLHHTHIVPIFAVGSEQGINFYAMQFIDGQSLDQVLRERTSQGQQLPYETVVQWGLQAAEALAHAHARGVIHRDVKPSNLLIDADENRVWLTDFGLAKKLDDVTLSLAGALLGTPRYMSPEQAAATHHEVDHRTDIYSLGASLYELLTGQALFRGESPHQVISQILTTDPEPPRHHRPDLPRDLETILMKCLSKDARQRYTSAGQLVNDLRALLEGRPIAARRASLIERTSRWVKRQKRSVALTASAVAVTLLLVILSVAGGYAWRQSRLAFVMLKSDRPPLVAEWIDGVKHVIPAATVPTQNRLEVPAGNYRLRLSSHDRLSQTYDVRLKPGEHFEHKLDLDDQLLWKDVKVERSYQPVRFDVRPEIKTPAAEPSTAVRFASAGLPSLRHSDVICFTHDGLQCLQGPSGEPRWSLDLRAHQHPLLNEQSGLVWPWDRFVTSTYARGLGIFDERPMLVSQADLAESAFMDFNEDGHSDLVMATRNQACVLAINGRSGEPLWIAARGEAASATNPAAGHVHQRLGGVLYPPQLVRDQDGDAVDDLLTAFITLKSEQSPPTRSIELISGATGQPVWRHELSGNDFALAASESVPYELQWFYGQGGGYSSGGGGFSLNDSYYLREHPLLERSGPHHYLPTRPMVIDGAASDTKFEDSQPDSLVALIAGRRLVLLDLRSGLLAGDRSEDSPAVELEIRPAIQPVAADFDGDGKYDLLLLEPVAPRKSSPNRQALQVRLAVWSIAKRTCLWQRHVTAPLPRQTEMDLPLPAWPLAFDIDGDGAAEVLTPSDCSDGLVNRGGPPWGKLTLLDGRTGKPRWQRQLFAMDQRLEHFISGPDLNNDRIREIFVATVWGTEGSRSEKSLFIDCLSGADGQTVWRTQQPLRDLGSSNSCLWLSSLRWHDQGADGWPQLIVPMRRSDADTADRTYLFSAGTGRMTQVAMGVTEIESGDLDADGIEDLLLFSRQSRSLTQGGTLQAVRGVGDEAWRQIPDSPLVAVGDLNGDGVRDLVTKQSRESIEAISGVSGAALWQTDVTTRSLVELQASAARQHDVDDSFLARDQDLNGDGVADLILVSHRGSSQYQRPLMFALSGNTGKELWQSEAAGQVITSVAWLDCRDLDGDGKAEVVMAAAFDHGVPQRQSFGSEEARLWLIVASGQTGRTQWIEPLTFEAIPGTGRRYRYDDVLLEAAYADLNGDGVLDVVLPGQRSPHDLALEVRGISGKDGRTLWRSPLPIDGDARESLANTSPVTIADIDGNGLPELVIVSLVESRTKGGRIENHVHLEMLDGASGESRWKWKTLADRWGNQIASHRGRPQDRLRAVLVRRRSGSHWIAVRLWNKNLELHVLDERGQLVSQSQHTASFGSQQNRIWTVDANGDGDDELVMLAQAQLMLVHPEHLETPLWQLPTPETGLTQILGVSEDHRMGDVLGKAAKTVSSPVVIVQAGADSRSVHGMDAATGQQLWTCVGPTPWQASHNDPAADLLNLPSEKIPPHAFFQFQSNALVRRGVAVGSPSAWQSFTRSRSEIPPILEDPRLLRPLPWKPAEYSIERMPPFAAWCAFYGLTLAMVPITWLILTLQHRQWSLRSMLGWAPAASIVMLGVIVDGPDGDFQTLPRKLMIAYFVAGPVLLTTVVLARWLWLGRWRGAVSWLGFALLTTIIMMAVSLAGTYWRDAGGLQPGERYRWDGWYWMAVPVFYLAAWALSLGVFLNWLRQPHWRFLRFHNHH